MNLVLSVRGRKKEKQKLWSVQICKQKNLFRKHDEPQTHHISKGTRSNKMGYKIRQMGPNYQCL